MKPIYFALIRHKGNKLKASLRNSYYKLLGMQINKSVEIGKINCSWPNKISLGSHTVIEDYVIFKTPQPFTDTNFIKIGERVFIGSGCNFNITLGLTIGNDCLISSNTTFVDAGRETNLNSNINKQQILLKEITIEDDVWIGTNCVILRGVTIAKGSIIGAGSVVNKSIPENQIWAGIPARFIKNR